MRKLKKEFTLREAKGFTLIELVVVMAIIAVLAVLVIGAITIARKIATETSNRSNAASMQAELEAFYANHRYYPTISNLSFKVLSGTTSGVQGWVPPHITTTCSGSVGIQNADDGGYVNSTATGYTISVVDSACTTVNANDQLTNK